MRLTKTAADAAKYPYDTAGRRLYVLWDDGVPGFGLRVHPSGRRVFVLVYRVADRKRWLTLGAYGTLTVQQARARAAKARAQVLDGEDPAEKRRQEREQGCTLRDLAAEYMQALESTRKASTVRGYRQLLDGHILPAFGKLRPAAITEHDVAGFHRRMRSTPYAGNRALFVLSKLLKLAERRGLREPGANPCANVPRYREHARKRYLSSDELVRLGDALRALEADGNVSPHAAAALRLLLFTGCRVNEVLCLRWQDIDLERGLARIPDSKTGEKFVPLTAPVLAVLDTLPRTVGNPWVIEGQKDGAHLTDLRVPWQRTIKAAGLDNTRLHDLRHTVGAWGASGGLSLLIVGRVLGHRQAASTERYAHVADDPVREAAERISGAIAAALDGKSADVVELRRAR